MDVPRLPALLREEVALLESFLALLEREQAHLVKGETEALAEIIAAKDAACRAWQDLALQRNAAIAVAYHVGASDPPEAWLATASEEERSLWQRLRELAARAQAVNRANGALIGIHLAHNQQALAALATADAALTYGADGAPSLARAQRRSLGEA